MNITNAEASLIRFALFKVESEKWAYIQSLKAAHMRKPEPETEDEAVEFGIDWIDFQTQFLSQKKKDQNPFTRDAIEEIAALEQELTRAASLRERLEEEYPPA